MMSGIAATKSAWKKSVSDNGDFGRQTGWVYAGLPIGPLNVIMPLLIRSDQLKDELKLVQLKQEELEVGVSDAVRIEKYWNYFMKLKGPDGSVKYPSVFMVVKACLSLSHGNADVGCISGCILHIRLTTWVSRHQKGKPFWILLKQEMTGWHWTICKSFAPHSIQITMPVPQYSIFYGLDALPDAQPTVSKHWGHTGCILTDANTAVTEDGECKIVCLWWNAGIWSQASFGSSNVTALNNAHQVRASYKAYLERKKLEEAEAKQKKAEEEAAASARRQAEKELEEEGRNCCL